MVRPSPQSIQSHLAMTLISFFRKASWFLISFSSHKKGKPKEAKDYISYPLEEEK